MAFPVRSANSFRDEKHKIDPQNAAEADRILSAGSDEIWRRIYQLLNRLENAERRAGERERLMETSDRLKAKMFDLMSLDPATKKQLECCHGLSGTSTVTGDEVHLHDPSCPARILSHAEVKSLGDMLRLLDSDELEDITDEQVSALRRVFAFNKQKLLRRG